MTHLQHDHMLNLTKQVIKAIRLDDPVIKVLHRVLDLGLPCVTGYC